MKLFRAVFTGIVGFGLCVASGAETDLTEPRVPRMQVIPLPGDKASFQRDGVELLRYHFGDRQERPFWFPLIHPKSGRSLTRIGHPHDPEGHSHHNSVWVSHHKVNGIDFWSDHKRDTNGRIVHQKVLQYADSDQLCAMKSLNHWIRRSDDAVLLAETRETHVVPYGAAKDYIVLITLHFSAPKTPVTFEANPFGVIGVRMAKTIGVHDGGGRILNSEGGRDEKPIFRKPARWVDYSGRIAPGMQGGIALMDHPSNPNHPAPFHVRNDGWMGACLTLEKPITISPDMPLRLHYGLWVHDGTPTKAEIDAVWATFSKPLAARQKDK